MATPNQHRRESFKTLAYKYGISKETFIKSIKSIRKKLDACVGRSNYRVLIPKQVKIIVEHLGEWEE